MPVSTIIAGFYTAQVRVTWGMVKGRKKPPLLLERNPTRSSHTSTAHSVKPCDIHEAVSKNGHVQLMKLA